MAASAHQTSMPYELSFLADGPVRPDRAVFERYFAGRPHWTVARGLATYDHEDTGVSFLFRYADPAAGAPAERHAFAIFGLELPRPSFFAEEATHEVGQFTRQFGSALAGASDFPGGRYTVNDFLKSWERANREACVPFRAHAAPGQPPFTMPRARLLASWQWNFRRKALQAEEGDVFVPRVWFVRVGDGVGTCVIWPDAMAMRVPQVDYVIFSSDGLVPWTRRGQPDVAVAPWSRIATLITGPAFFNNQLANWRVTDARVLNGITRLSSTLRGKGEMPDFLPPDAVLDEECFAPER